MNQIFSTLHIPKKRNRSGDVFFGFNRSEDLKVLKCRIAEYNPGNVDPAFQKLENIRIRNAGKTSCLVKKNRLSRNDAIHDAVKLASFDDVESKYHR